MLKQKATIEISQAALKKGVVILGLDKYRKLEAKTVPTYYFTGRKARGIDDLVEYGLKEYKNGKTKKIKSLVDLK